MTPVRPTRSTYAGRVYLDLQNLARRTGRPTDELHQLYALEGFLVRLVSSEHADRLVLKGGVLLAAYDTRRPTRDIDFLGQWLSNETESVLALVRSIAALPVDDGLTFDLDSATVQTIRDEDDYSGVRVTMTGSLATARLSLHIDVNVGDPVCPRPQTVLLPRLLDDPLPIIGYPLAMVHAEKIVTAVQRGTANTRLRDFADIYLLSGRHDLPGAELRAAITTVAAHRQAELRPLAAVLDGFAALAQSRWAGWRRRQRMEQRMPTSFEEVLAQVIAFADPCLLDQVNDRVWLAERRSWA